jgi:Predicted permeases
MRRLDRLVLSEIIGPFFGSALLFTGLFLAGGEFMRLAEYAQQGVAPWLIAQLVLLSLPPIIALTFPMAMLLAALLGMGRMSGDSEVVAITAAGVSFPRVVVPIAAFALLVSLGGVYINDTIVPVSARGRQAIIDQQKQRIGQTVSSNAVAAQFRRDNELYDIRAEGGLQGGVLHRVSVVYWKGGRVVRTLYADEARWVPGTLDWTLSSDFYGTDYSGANKLIISGKAGTTEAVPLGTPEEMEALKRPEIEVTTRGLQERVRVLRAGGNETGARAAEVEIARRVAVPFATLVFALVGAPLGVRPQRAGKGVGFGLSVIITFVYWIALQFASVLGRGGTLPPGLAVMLPNVIGILLGLYLTRRVLR